MTMYAHMCATVDIPKPITLWTNIYSTHLYISWQQHLHGNMETVMILILSESFCWSWRKSVFSLNVLTAQTGKCPGGSSGGTRWQSGRQVMCEHPELIVWTELHRQQFNTQDANTFSDHNLTVMNKDSEYISWNNKSTYKVNIVANGSHKTRTDTVNMRHFVGHILKVFSCVLASIVSCGWGFTSSGQKKSNMREMVLGLFFSPKKNHYD